MRIRAANAAVVLLIVCAGCGAADEAAPPPPSTSEKPVVALTAARLDAFERGLRKEIEAVRAAQALSSQATTSEERGKAIEASFEHKTIPLGAEAAGLPLREYSDVRELVTGIFQTLDFQGTIDGPLSIDLSRADAATKERLARDPLAALPAQSADALREKMDRLVPVWVEYMTLTAVAG